MDILILIIAFLIILLGAELFTNGIEWVGRKLDLADDLQERLPEVGDALYAGWLDEPKARTVCDQTRDLAEDHAHEVCRIVLPEAPELPVGALIERIEQVATALDPEWAERRGRVTTTV